MEVEAVASGAERRVRRRSWRPVLWTGLGLLMDQAQMDRTTIAQRLGVNERTIAGWLWCRFYPSLPDTLRLADTLAQALGIGVGRVLVILLADMPRVPLDAAQRRARLQAREGQVEP